MSRGMGCVISSLIGLVGLFARAPFLHSIELEPVFKLLTSLISLPGSLLGGKKKTKKTILSHRFAPYSLLCEMSAQGINLSLILSSLPSRGRWA